MPPHPAAHPTLAQGVGECPGSVGGEPKGGEAGLRTESIPPSFGLFWEHRQLKPR